VKEPMKIVSQEYLPGSSKVLPTLMQLQVQNAMKKLNSIGNTVIGFTAILF